MGAAHTEDAKVSERGANLQPVSRGEQAARIMRCTVRARNRCVANFEPRGVLERGTFYSFILFSFS